MASKNLRDALIMFGDELAKEKDAAFDLWSWLPSRQAAEVAHGDYASSYCPSVRDIMTEAATFIGHRMAPTPEQLASEELYQCPCGVDHSLKDVPEEDPADFNP